MNTRDNYINKQTSRGTMTNVPRLECKQVT